MNYTLFWVDTDLTMITAIFNMIAMVCNNSDLIFGAALLAGAFKVSVHSFSHGHLKSTLSAAAVDAMVVPMIIALSLTSGSLKTNLTIESTVSGALTSVANVPMVIAIVPTVASQVGQTVGGAVETAFQGVNTSYSQISASGTGFLNPLRVLLATRTAVNDLGLIPTQINAVVSSCLNDGAGLDLAGIQVAVKDVQNSGVSNNQTLAINGNLGTSIGALLYLATQSTGTVQSISDITGGGTPVPISATCSDAAVMVQKNIDFALNSSNFSRVVQGAIQSSDNPIQNPSLANAYTLDTLTSQYGSIRNPNAMVQATGGQTQANTEFLNLLFSETVEQNLDCLSASGSSKTMCESDILTRTELERKAMKDAANANIAMKYLGIFSNDLLAILIGLGPVLFILMMFMGENFAKPLNAWVQMMIWPILMTQVGAELINGIMYFKVATFFQSMSQGGYISQALAYNAYTELANQISMASSLMGGLPQLIGVIFALGGSAALTSVANEIRSGQTDTADSLAPPLQNAAPLQNRSAMSEVTTGPGFATEKSTGQLTPLNSSVGTSASQKLMNNLNTAHANVVTDTENRELATSIQKGWTDSKGNEHKLSSGVSAQLTNAKRNSASESQDQSNAVSVNTSKSNQDSSGLDLSSGLNGAMGEVDGGASVPLGASVKTGTTAQSIQQKNNETAHKDAVSKARSNEKALVDTRNWANDSNSTQSDRNALDKAVKGAHSIVQGLTSSDSRTEAQTQEAAAAREIGQYSQSNIGNAEWAWGYAHSSALQNVEKGLGRAFEASNPKAMGEAEKRMNSGLVATTSGINVPNGVLQRHMAANAVISDNDSTPEARTQAANYLGKSLDALTAQNGYREMDQTIRDKKPGTPSTSLRGKEPQMTRDVDRLSQAWVPNAKTTESDKQPLWDKKAPIDAEPIDLRNVTSKVAKEEARADNEGLGKTSPGTLWRSLENVAKKIIH